MIAKLIEDYNRLYPHTITTIGLYDLAGDELKTVEGLLEKAIKDKKPLTDNDIFDIPDTAFI